MRHHYVPIFYLLPWLGADRKLCEYSRPYREAKPFRKHPAATGYVDGLYTVPGLPPDQAQFVERQFMKVNDDWAAKAQQLLHSPNAKSDDMTAQMSVAWARFIYSLIVRNPENLERLKGKASELEMRGSAQALLPYIINSERVITLIVREMQFHTITIHEAKSPS